MYSGGICSKTLLLWHTGGVVNKTKSMFIVLHKDSSHQDHVVVITALGSSIKVCCV